jgi:hypothetical protein
LAQLRVLGTAPPALQTKIGGIKRGYWHGIVVRLRQGVALYFGAATDLRAKWQAVVAVLALPQSAGAGYVDVTDPWRPAAGPPAPPVAASATAATATSAATASAAAAPTANGG